MVYARPMRTVHQSRDGIKNAGTRCWAHHLVWKYLAPSAGLDVYSFVLPEARASYGRHLAAVCSRWEGTGSSACSTRGVHADRPRGGCGMRTVGRGGLMLLSYTVALLYVINPQYVIISVSTILF